MPSDQMVEEKMFRLAKKQWIGGLMGVGKDLEFTHQHLEVTCQPRIRDREKVVDCRNRRAHQFARRKPAHRVRCDVDMQRFAWPCPGPFGASACGRERYRSDLRTPMQRFAFTATRDCRRARRPTRKDAMPKMSSRDGNPS